MKRPRFHLVAFLRDLRLVPASIDPDCATPSSNGHDLGAERGWERFEAMLRRVSERISHLNERQRQRAHLRQLDEHLLKDIGVTPEQARQEAQKPPWRD